MEFKQEYIKRLNKAFQFIEKNYSENIKLEDIADAANFSCFHFHRIFQSMCDETPGGYLRRIRLEKAAYLLRFHRDYSISRIATETGFSSPAVFSRAFRERFDLSAKDYRNKTKNSASNQLSFTGFPFITEPQIEKQYELKEIIQLPSLDLAYVRSMNGYGPDIEKAWNALFSWAYPNKLMSSGIKMFGLPMDDPEITPKNKCRYFAAITIDKPIKANSPIEFMKLNKGKYAVFDFAGKSKDIPVFYKFLYGIWLPGSGYLPDDRPLLEEYSIKSKIQIDPADNQKVFRYSLLLPIRHFNFRKE